MLELLPTAPLHARIWQLRANVSGYGAAYVAAAEAFGCTLITADTRLARANGLQCKVRLGVLDVGSNTVHLLVSR